MLEQTLTDELKMEYVPVTSPQSDQLPVELIAQLVEHGTSIADVMGSNHVQPEFFSGFDLATA